VVGGGTSPLGDPRLLGRLVGAGSGWGVLTAVDCVDRRECDEYREVGVDLADSVDAESDIVCDCHAVFTAIDKMREYVSSVVVTAKALQGTPDAGES